MRISKKEVKINLSLGETMQFLKVSLTKRPTRFRSRINKVIESTEDTGLFSSSYFFNEQDPNSGTYRSGQRHFSPTGVIRYDYDEIEEDFSSEVTLIFENPNPALFTIVPTQLTFNSSNYNIPKTVTIQLKERTRYCTEYYPDVKIFAESQTDQFYDGMEFYYDISVLVGELRNSFFKNQNPLTDDVYTFPAAPFRKKKLKLKKLKIVGCYFSTVAFPVSVITFGDKPYKKTDIIQIISQLNGVDPALVVIPGEYPTFSPVDEFPLEMAHKCVGVDGRIFSSSGTLPYNQQLLESTAPHTLRLVISDLWTIDIPLSNFTITSSPTISQNGLSAGPLSNAVMEAQLNDTILVEQDFLRKMDNGDVSLYYYGIFIGGDNGQTDIKEIFPAGLTLCRPFQLQLEADISQNCIEEQTESITHYLSLKKESSDLKPIFSDFSNEIEFFCHGSSSEGTKATIKTKRNGLNRVHEEILIFDKSCELVWWNLSTENFFPTYTASTGLETSLNNFYSNNDSIESGTVNISDLNTRVLLPHHCVSNGSVIFNKIFSASKDQTTNQFIIEREKLEDNSTLSPLVFDLSLISKYGFVINAI